MRYQKPNLFYYRLAQIVSWIVATFVFCRRFRRNEIKGKKGPFVVIANHQTALDFVNLIGATARPMSFVISKSFFSTLPIKGFLDKMGVIPKQQFQTSVRDLRRIKSVIDAGQPLVIYPAGLMCEDGLSTPIPAATYKFLKWLNADVYVARCTGTYFVMPKWSSKIRIGRTEMDIYQLFDRQTLAESDLAAIKEKTDAALLFDAYREQEHCNARYWCGENIEGLEHVLYLCPHCGGEYTMSVQNKHTIRCGSCGYALRSDNRGFLHNDGEIGPELRYVSDWSRLVFQTTGKQISDGSLTELKSATMIQVVDQKKCRFVDAGQGELQLTSQGFVLRGELQGKLLDLTIPVEGIPTLPFKPGRYLELQHGNEIYRCVLADGNLAMKYINMVKLFYELGKVPIHA